MTPVEGAMFSHLEAALFPERSRAPGPVLSVLCECHSCSAGTSWPGCQQAVFHFLS